MKTDERDEGLARLLEREISWLEPDPAGHLPTIWRRGMRRRTYRLTAAVTAVAVFVGAVTVAGLYVHEHRPATAEDISDWPTYRNGSSGWTMRYPESWQVSDFKASCRAYYDGAIVVNFPDTYQPPHPCLTGFSDLPDTGVAIALLRQLWGPAVEPDGPRTGPPNTPLPLSLEDMTPGTPPSPAHGSASPGTFYGQAVWAAQGAYSLDVWIGPNASDSDREIASQIVASIAFETQGIPPDTIALSWTHGPMPGVTLPRSRAVFVSPTVLAFVTVGGGSCPYLPAALHVLGPSAIRMPVALYNPDKGACTTDRRTTTVEVALDPTQIDVGHALTIHIVYPKGGRQTLHARGLG